MEGSYFLLEFPVGRDFGRRCAIDPPWRKCQQADNSAVRYLIADRRVGWRVSEHCGHTESRTRAGRRHV
jgi:hypothetical protein